MTLLGEVLGEISRENRIPKSKKEPFRGASSAFSKTSDNLLFALILPRKDLQ